MNYRLDYPSGGFVQITPDPAEPGAMLITEAPGTRRRTFIIPPDECCKLARAIADYVPFEEPGVRPCPVCGHDEREEERTAP